MVNCMEKDPKPKQNVWRSSNRRPHNQNHHNNRENNHVNHYQPHFGSNNQPNVNSGGGDADRHNSSFTVSTTNTSPPLESQPTPVPHPAPANGPPYPTMGVNIPAEVPPAWPAMHMNGNGGGTNPGMYPPPHPGTVPPYFRVPMFTVPQFGNNMLVYAPGYAGGPPAIYPYPHYVHMMHLPAFPLQPAAAAPPPPPVPVPPRPRNLSCYNCGAAGHTGYDCTEPTFEELLRPNTYRLNYCRSAGPNDCPENG